MLTQIKLVCVAEEKGAGVVQNSDWDSGRIPLDGVFGAGDPGGVRRWIRDFEREDDGPWPWDEGWIDERRGRRARRPNGELESGEDRGETLHGSMGVNEWRVSMRGDESRYCLGGKRCGKMGCDEKEE